MLKLLMAVPEKVVEGQRRSLVAEGPTDAGSICRNLAEDFRRKGINIPPQCRCLCLRGTVQEVLDNAPIKKFAFITMETLFLVIFDNLRPQSSPETIAS